jgi:hypothetical protein
MPSLSKYPKLELKYCERCGGLWLRPRGGDLVYCAECAVEMSGLPPVGPRGGAAPAIKAAYALATMVALALRDFAECFAEAIA